MSCPFPDADFNRYLYWRDEGDQGVILGVHIPDYWLNPRQEVRLRDAAGDAMRDVMLQIAPPQNGEHHVDYDPTCPKCGEVSLDGGFAEMISGRIYVTYESCGHVVSYGAREFEAIYKEKTNGR